MNDTYVSCRVISSEHGAVLATKRNQSEERLIECEDKRYEFSIKIDANLNTISLLENVQKRMDKMTPEEQDKFKLKPGLGGQSVSIYESIIKFVYDKPRGLKMIEWLYEYPAIAVPVILRRLKEMDAIWRREEVTTMYFSFCNNDC